MNHFSCNWWAGWDGYVILSTFLASSPFSLLVRGGSVSPSVGLGHGQGSVEGRSVSFCVEGSAWFTGGQGKFLACHGMLFVVVRTPSGTVAILLALTLLQLAHTSCSECSSCSGDVRYASGS